MEEHKGVPNASLTLSDIKMDDRGYYTCVGISGNTTSEAQSYVRVKGKPIVIFYRILFT